MWSEGRKLLHFSGQWFLDDCTEIFK
jgi:hypothetical protein